MGCLPGDLQERQQPLKAKVGKLPMKAMVLVGVSIGCLQVNVRSEKLHPGRNYIRPAPPPPISGQKAFSRGGGWGCIF